MRLIAFGCLSALSYCFMLQCVSWSYFSYSGASPLHLAVGFSLATPWDYRGVARAMYRRRVHPRICERVLYPVVLLFSRPCVCAYFLYTLLHLFVHHAVLC